jgi:hypothetical protein
VRATGGHLAGLGVDDDGPPRAVLAPGQTEVDVLVVGVEGHHERVVDDALAAGVDVGEALPVEEHRDGLAEAGVPVVLGHLLAGRGEPGDVRQRAGAAPPDGPALEEAAAAEHRVAVAQRHHAGGEVDELGVLARQRPVHPRGLVVLAVDVVVALLGAARARRRAAASARPG